MEIDKKGVMAISFVVMFVIGLMIFIASVPMMTDAVEDADNTVLGCASGGSTPTLNETFTPALCCNLTDCGTNSTPLQQGLTGGQETLMLLTITMIIIGIVVLIVKRLGFF